MRILLQVPEIIPGIYFLFLGNILGSRILYTSAADLFIKNKGKIFSKNLIKLKNFFIKMILKRFGP